MGFITGPRGREIEGEFITGIRTQEVLKEEY